MFIQHALNGGEKQIGNFFVDRYADREGVEYVWEFLGCFYHGCPTCFNPRTVSPLAGVPFEKLHRDSEEKLRALESVYGARITFIR